MISFFPEALPGELAYSWFCRYHLRAGYPTHKATMEDLYCKRSDIPSKEFVGNLNPNARTIIAKICPVHEIVLRYTMFSQYARFVPLAQKENALRHLGWDSTDVHHLFAILPRAEGEQYLRYCSLCVAKDRADYGEAYWHTHHQIRNMVVCPEHGCRLISSAVPAKSEQCFTFCPAEMYITDTEVAWEANTKLFQFAKYMAAVFDAPMDLTRDIPISAILYHRMSKTKYLKATGRSRYTKALVEDMTAFYGSMGLPSVATMSQVQRVLLRDRYDFSVVCQLAFFLNMSVEELTDPKLTPEQMEAEEKSHYMTDKPPIDWAEFDAETAKILEPLAQSIYDGSARADGRPERVSEKMIYRELGLQGHRLEKMPLCRSIIERYSEPTYEEHWARRLVWAYQKLKKECGTTPFYWSDIREISGVRKKNADRIAPYLREYTGQETAEKIIDLMK